MESKETVKEKIGQGASQNGGEFRTTSGENHWSPQPATLVNPKSGMHPSGIEWAQSKIGRLVGQLLSNCKES